MKSVIALVAFAFFALNAATMSPAGWDAPIQPLYEMFRIAFIGLALMCLIPVDWRRIAGFLDVNVEVAGKADKPDEAVQAHEPAE